MSSFSFDQFPIEILIATFRHLDIPDILRARKVCKFLNTVSHCRDVWAHAYRKANFVRPPGPFPSQSASDLENALASSFRIKRNLEAGGAARKLGEVQYTGVDICVSLVLGQFLLIASREEVRCYNVNLDPLASNAGPDVIYRPTSGILKWCRCVSAFDVDGRAFACMVLKEEIPAQDQTQVSIYSFKVTEQSVLTLDLLHKFTYSEFNIDSVDLGPRAIVVQGTVGSSRDGLRVVALDVHAPAQFRLLSFTDALWNTAEISKWANMYCLSTSTHILLAVSSGCDTLFQAFALPLPNMYAGSTPLSCSHRATISGISSITAGGLLLLHDAVVDPSTQDILVMIQVFTFKSPLDDPLLKYGFLRLGTSDLDTVGTITFEPLGPFHFDSMAINRPSFHGIGRSFSMHVISWKRSGIEMFVAVTEYVICSDDVPAKRYPDVQWSSDLCKLVDYDPYLGRICLEYPSDGVVEILDFDV